MSRHVALTVGVDAYEDSQLTTLRCAVRDATELAAFLRYRAGYDRVEQLVSGVTDDQVVDAAVRLVRELEPGDLFLFYFSGHGIEYAGRHVLLCPKARYDRLQFYRQTVPIDQLRDETIQAGVDRVFILDACRTNPVAGRGGGGLCGEGILRDVVTHARPGTSTSGAGSFGMMFSCSEGEQAGELVSRQNGLFTAALLSVLDARVKAGDEVGLDDELRVGVAREMAALGTKEGLWHAQNPWHQSSGPGVPILIPTRTPEGEPSHRPPATAPPAQPEPVVSQEPTGARPLPSAAPTGARSSVSIRCLCGWVCLAVGIAIVVLLAIWAGKKFGQAQDANQRAGAPRQPLQGRFAADSGGTATLPLSELERAIQQARTWMNQGALAKAQERIASALQSYPQDPTLNSLQEEVQQRLKRKEEDELRRATENVYQ